MTDFDKEAYWKNRNNTVTTGKGKDKQIITRPLRGQGKPFKAEVAAHASPDWPAKPVGKKRAAAIERRRQLALIADLNGQLFMMDHPLYSHKPVRKNCFYCQETNIYRDGVCAGHWEFLYKNMSNKQRMIEKAYHRDQRAQELQRKRDEARKEREQVAV